MNLFKKSSLWKLIIAIFTLSLYARVAEAKGVATIFVVIAVIFLVAIVILGPIGLGLIGVSSAGTTSAGMVVASWVAGVVGTASLVGMAVGQVQCLMGQDNVWFSGCSEGAATPVGWEGAPGSPALTNASFTATCDSVSLTYDISNANQYGIYQAGNLVTSGNAQGLSKITYTDTNLAKQTYYQYVLVMTNNQGEQFQYPPINAYTKCLPQCTFSADKDKVVFPAKITLSWECQYADSCSISPDVGSVDSSDQTIVTPIESTNYILTCSNIDGSTSFSTSINVIKPKLEEVAP